MICYHLIDHAVIWIWIWIWMLSCKVLSDVNATGSPSPFSCQTKKPRVSLWNLKKSWNPMMPQFPLSHWAESSLVVSGLEISLSLLSLVKLVSVVELYSRLCHWCVDVWSWLTTLPFSVYHTQKLGSWLAGIFQLFTSWWGRPPHFLYFRQIRSWPNLTMSEYVTWATRDSCPG